MIPVNEPLFQGNEKKYLNECIDTGWISSEGPFIPRFEQQFAAKMGRQHGIAVANGSVAIDIALAALGISTGDEVILPTFTIISCASAIVRLGAIPVVVDVDPRTWNQNVSLIEGKITSRTKAIMVVHIYGLPVDMDPVLSLAKKYGLKVIEDAAEMHGQTYRGRPCGSFGDVSTFSFYANKHVTTGEGGMIVVSDQALADRCRSFRNLCFLPERRFVHEELGWNARLTNMQAAVGLAQLERLDEVVEKKRAIGAAYTKLLRENPHFEIPLEETDYAKNIYWVYGIVFRDSFPASVEQVMKRLGDAKIGSRPFFWCMHEQPVFLKMGLFRGEKLPHAERLARRGFYLPSGLGLTGGQMAEVASAFLKIVGELAS